MPKTLRRIVIVWTCFHLFALSTNLLNLNFKVTKHRMEHCQFEYTFKGEYKMAESDYCAHPLIIYLFSSPTCENETKKEFWPFVNYFVDNRTHYSPCTLNEPKYINNLNVSGVEYFLGIFYSYDFLEFFVYCSFPFLLILIKKFW